MGLNLTIQEYLRELECMGDCDPDAILSELSQNRQAILADVRSYYDRNQDSVWIDSYYSGIAEDDPASGGWFDRLHDLLSRTHRQQIPYYVSKDQYLYKWVDLQANGMMRCLYSGEEKNPEHAIGEDLETIRKRSVRFRQLVVHDRHARNKRLLEQIRMIAKENKFNTEHVVPQSWFGEREPMKGDLHHLFVCQPRCNTARANFHYSEFQRTSPDVMFAGDCGVSEPGRFEPKHGKGAAARALLYFLLRYPGAIKRAYREEMDVSLLLRWHREYSVTEHERHRNKAIYEVQGNRNPLIDFPEWADRIDFAASK